MGLTRKTKKDYIETGRLRGYEWIGEVAPARNSIKTVWNCETHGSFYMRYSDMQHGYGCPKCGKEKSDKAKRLTIDDYVAMADKCGIEWIGLMVPHNNIVKTEWKCNKHGKFEKSYNNMKRWPGCSKCGNDRKGSDRRLSSADYKSLGEANGYKWISDRVPRNNSIKTTWECSEHGIFHMSYSSMQSGNGCCLCNASDGERKTANAIVDLGLEFAKQQRAEGCIYKKPLRYDFYIPSMKTFIEFHGRQHYECNNYFGGEKAFKEYQKRDQIKMDWARNNGYRLIVIPYWITDIHDHLFISLSVQLPLFDLTT